MPTSVKINGREVTNPIARVAVMATVWVFGSVLLAIASVVMVVLVLPVFALVAAGLALVGCGRYFYLRRKEGDV